MRLSDIGWRKKTCAERSPRISTSNPQIRQHKMSIERASAFYARQGYDFGVDNVDVVRMLAEYNRECLAAIAKTLRSWSDVHFAEGEDEACQALRHAALFLDELPY